MKIRIEIPAEEVTKCTEIITSILPGIDISQYVHTDHHEVEIKCNAYEMKTIDDPDTGVCTEMNIKTHFIVWTLRKMKPFIATFTTLWHMFIDFCEDINLMIGDVTINHNGEDLCAKLYNMAKDDGYINEDDDTVDSHSKNNHDSDNSVLL